MLRKLVYLAVWMIGVAFVALLILRLSPFWDNILAPPPAVVAEFRNLDAPATPNWHLVCPADYCPEGLAHDISPVFDETADVLRRAIFTEIGAQPGVRVRLQAGNNLELVARTPWLRWPDLVSIRVIALSDGKSTVAIYSRSVYGRSDYGANRERISHWLARIGNGEKPAAQL